MSGAICISDLHLHNYSLFVKPWKFGCNTRLRDQLEVLKAVFITANERNSPIIFLGDLFNDWSSIHTNLHSTVVKALFNYCDLYETHLYILPGNHDETEKGKTDMLTLYGLSGHPLIHLITEPRVININDISCGFIPYTDDVAYFMREAKEFERRKVPVLLSHIDIIGATSSIEGYHAKFGIDPSILSPMFKQVILGHYHKMQTILGNIHYVGSLTQLWPMDERQPRGYATLKKSGVCNEATYSVRQHPIVTGPRFETIHINSLDGLYNGDFLNSQLINTRSKTFLAKYNTIKCPRNLMEEVGKILASKAPELNYVLKPYDFPQNMNVSPFINNQDPFEDKNDHDVSSYLDRVNQNFFAPNNLINFKYNPATLQKYYKYYITETI